MTNTTQCQNCGQANAVGSQFCRFCGTRFLAESQRPPQYPQAQQYSQPQYENQPPRPYAWKTDEFQTQNESRRTQPGVVDPGFGNAGNAMAHSATPFMASSYRCPNCMSQFLPRIEKRISTAGWITFAILLVFFFPLFWIGLLIKEEVHTCPSCNMRLK